MSQAIMQRQTTKGPSAWEVTLANTKLWLKSPTPYLNALGLVAFVLFWYLTTEYFQLPYFEKLPGPVASFQEWVSKDPIYGISIYTSDYYAHIGISVWRVFQAFMLATLLGVPTGLFMGWNKTFKDYSFPLLETLRPIPMLAWVPLAILMWPGREASIVFLTFLGSYFATVLNTLLGVESIDESYFRAARSLGARPPRRILQGHPAGRHAVHLHRPSDQHGVRVVLAGRGRNARGRIRPRLPHLELVHAGAIPRDHHRHDHARRHRLVEQLAHPYDRQPPHAVEGQGGSTMSGNETPTRGHIQINNVSKIYDPDGAKVLAVDRCTMDIAPGEFCVVVGPSGCGKTTLLNAIAGFHSISSGEILLDGEVLCSADKQAQPGSDRIVVFQNGALFPWFTVLENVTFGPIVQKAMSKEEAEDKAMEMLGQMGLMGIENNYPSEISSGMRRRVEIARAMMNNPRVLLLDEPFRAMDALTKTVVHQFLLQVYDRSKTTVFFITHDLEEAIFLGSKVYIMTTRPATIKKILDVDIPRPRDFRVLSSPTYTRLKEECISAVHEEALKAFKAGEREM